MNPKRFMSWITITKMAKKNKAKERTLKAPREKQLVMHKAAPKRLSADFSADVLPARRCSIIYSK